MSVGSILDDVIFLKRTLPQYDQGMWDAQYLIQPILLYNQLHP